MSDDDKNDNAIHNSILSKEMIDILESKIDRTTDFTGVRFRSITINAPLEFTLACIAKHLAEDPNYDPSKS